MGSNSPSNTDMQEPRSDSATKAFQISILGDYTLTVADIWPDGNAPENPTIDDVMKAMPSSVPTLIREWNLIPAVEVYET